MSYRELRDFCEHLRALGYPRSVSLDSFRQPNFPLIADLLAFLLRRYDPTIIHNESIDTQPQRVHFIQSLSSLALVKCNTRLSMKALYRADGFAVRELLKLSAVLYKAVIQSQWDKNTDGSITRVTTKSDTITDGGGSNDTIGVSAVDEFREARALSHELIDLGEKLSLALSKESDARPSRDTALSFVDSISGESQTAVAGGQSSVERIIRKQLELMSDNLSELTTLIGSLRTDTTKMSEKLVKKDAEHDRIEKRFHALKKIKPAFAEELENQEKEIKVVYNEYINSVRNLNFLEHELNSLRQEEHEEKAENDRLMKRMQAKLKQEEMKILRGEQQHHGDSDSDDDDNDSEADDDDDEDEDEDGSEVEGEESKTMISNKHRADRSARDSDEEDDNDDQFSDDDGLMDEDDGDGDNFDDDDGGDGEESKYSHNKAKPSSSIHARMSAGATAVNGRGRAAADDSDTDDDQLF